VIKDTNIFIDNVHFSPSGMMENIAQTCAARVGFYNKYVLHKDVQVGFIGAVRNYVINELPPVGTTIHTKVDILQDIFGMTLANAEVVSGDTVYATAEIKLSVRNVE
jgi:predicted hotdog family 3-hydroxylacyl-ACP dehydratase